MMPAGKYYVGDLCYVMHDEWDEACSLFFQGRKDNGCNEGEFNLRDGRRFVSYSTKWGDGTYKDQFGKQYGVDAGIIGLLILLVGISFVYFQKQHLTFINTYHSFKFSITITINKRITPSFSFIYGYVVLYVYFVLL